MRMSEMLMKAVNETFKNFKKLTDNSLFNFPSFIIGCGKAFEIISERSAGFASGLSSSSPTP